MFKKIQKESSITSSKCKTEDSEEITLKRSGYSLLNVIGSLNIKRWNALKTAFSCKTNEHFVTKLLDIAQEHFYRKKVTKENDVPKVLRRINRNKNKINLKFNKKRHREKKYCDNKKNIINGADENKIADGINKENDTTGHIIPVIDENCTKIGNLSLCKLDDFQEKSTQKNTNRTLLERKKSIFSKHDDTSKSRELHIKYNKVNENQNDKLSKNLEIIKIKVCQHCSSCHTQDQCPIYYPHHKIKDYIDFTCWREKHKKNYESTKITKTIVDMNSEVLKQKEKYSYSVMSLPKDLYFADTNTNHGVGVFAKNDIQPYCQFGPLVGKIIKEVDIPEDFGMKDLWEINYENGNIYVNTECRTLSNWLKYIRPAPKKEEKNLTVISKEKKLYFVSVTSIKCGEELLYWQESPFSTNKKKMEKTTCGGCNMVFSHPHYYRIHCSVFHDLRYSLTIRKYHCKVCGAAVLGKENIMKHAAELHNGQGAYQCQFCKRFFLRLNYLEMHRTYGCSANPHRARPLCDFCGRKFCQPQKLKVHIKRMHSDFSEVLKEFQCKSCLKILGSRAALQRHSKEVHQKQVEDACSCARCGKKFQNKSNLKIHMLTHSGIKPFRCSAEHCSAAFTTKQCLQFHYKKVHNFTEKNMPKIERSIDYTFQAYSGVLEDEEGKSEKSNMSKTSPVSHTAEESEDSDNDSTESHDIDHLTAIQTPPPAADEQNLTPNSSPTNNCSVIPKNTNIKVLSKGSKKWIADELAQSESVDVYATEKLNKDQLTDITLQETEVYSKNKHMGISDFSRQEASNASLLVEAALDSVCSEPNIDIDVSTTPNCNDSLVNNLYSLSQPESLPDVSYTDTTCINEQRDINLISPLVNNQVSGTVELNNELRHNQNVRIDYPGFHHEEFDSPNSPGVPRSSFVRHYINSMSSHNITYNQKNLTSVSPPRYDFGHMQNTDHLSSDDSNGMAAQNLSLHNSKSDIQLDLSIYKPSYKSNNQNYIRRMKFENDNSQLHQDHVNALNQDNISSNMQSSKLDKDSNEDQVRSKYSDVPNGIHNKFEIDLDLRFKSYDNIENENIKQKNASYDNSNIDFKTKEYDLLDEVENRNKQYENVDSDLRIDRSFEPLSLNSSELQGLDMSARSFHNYPNINRYHHLYSEVDRVDLRFNYSPPPPTYSHSDILRVVSLDLTPPGRHNVDLSLRSHPLHQIANSRLLTEHGLQTSAHRLIDQSRLLSTDLGTTRHLSTDSRLISEAGNRILSEHTTTRILSANDQLTTNHLLNCDQNRLITDNSRIISDQTRLLEQGRIIGESRLLTSTPSGTVSPVQAFNGYSVTQSPYHPTPITPRQHVSSPTPTPYHHYPSYY